MTEVSRAPTVGGIPLALLRLIERRKAGCCMWSSGAKWQGAVGEEIACQWDLKRIVAKRKEGSCVVNRSEVRLKIKNPDDTQGKGRQDLPQELHSVAASASPWRR
jgi:hypothetical protein